MKPHDAFRELAAAAIDFPLSGAERSRLDAHVAGCPECARFVAGLRVDAQLLTALPRMTVPERRGTEILQAALHPAHAAHPLRLVVVAALLALLAIGSVTVGAEFLGVAGRTCPGGSVPTATDAPDASEPAESAARARPCSPDHLMCCSPTSALRMGSR